MKDNADVLGSFVVTHVAMARDFSVDQDSFDFVKLQQGAGASAVQKRIDSLLAQRFPTAQVRNQQELKQFKEGDKVYKWDRCSECGNVFLSTHECKGAYGATVCT